MDKETENKIIELYVKLRKSSNEIAKLFEINSTTVLRLLKKNNIDRRQKTYKYTCNNDFFEIIDTEEKAY